MITDSNSACGKGCAKKPRFVKAGFDHQTGKSQTPFSLILSSRSGICFFTSNRNLEFRAETQARTGYIRSMLGNIGSYRNGIGVFTVLTTMSAHFTAQPEHGRDPFLSFKKIIINMWIQPFIKAGTICASSWVSERESEVSYQVICDH